MLVLKEIPQPKTFGPLGNLPLLDKNKPTQSFCKLADEYGPIYRFSFPGDSRLFVSGHRLVQEVSNENKFEKAIDGPLETLQAFLGDGLVTTETEDLAWQKAHRILLPTFRQEMMERYHDGMYEIVSQLLEKWTRVNDGETVHIAEDMTRLTLDTIGLCGFNYRFNSFYREKPHEFVTSMYSALEEAMFQTQRLGIQNKLMVRTQRQYRKNIQVMFNLVDDIIKRRRKAGDAGEKDLLGLMLQGQDPETGEMLSDENIRYQILSFLIAGHETTSGLLSFCLYHLLKHPAYLEKAYAEVRDVLIDEKPTYEQVTQLHYIKKVLQEGLRLHPVAPVFTVKAKEDVILDNQYEVKKGEAIIVLMPSLHRDEAAWGSHAKEFRPERFANYDDIPHHAYKPFGNGVRACIGMQFAMHEATLALGLIIREFELGLKENYELVIEEKLTMKPDNFRIEVVKRSGKIAEKNSDSANNNHILKQKLIAKHGTRLTILYGSNLGTAKKVATRLAHFGQEYGYTVEIGSLNEYVDQLPREGLVLIISASYNGMAPDNARTFIDWLKGLGDSALTNITYGVFGCGNSIWTNTYQEVPRLIDDLLHQKGATQLVRRGEGNENAQFEVSLMEWLEQVWQKASVLYHIPDEQASVNESNLQVEFINSTEPDSDKQFYGVVTTNLELQRGTKRSTRRIDILLPSGITYSVGDHLGVIPKNDDRQVDRYLRRFKLHKDQEVILSSTETFYNHLPLNKQIKIGDLLKNYVELQNIVTRDQINELSKFITCPPHQQELRQLQVINHYNVNVREKRLTLIDLLELYPSCELPFAKLLQLLPAMEPRLYSISSSANVNPGKLSLTVGVVNEKASNGNQSYEGVCSNYLANMKRGERMKCFIKKPEPSFTLPSDVRTPIIMVAMGTGIAPFRGFLQEREEKYADCSNLGSAYLYYGCRHPEHDYFYKEELTKYKSLTIYPAFSRFEANPKTYVQDLIARDGSHIIKLIESGAVLYICGDGIGMAPAVEKTLCSAYEDVYGVTSEEAQNWLVQLLRTGQYCKDVWKTY